MDTYSVGDIRDEWKHAGTLIRIDYNETWLLTIGFQDISPREIKELKTGDIRATFTLINKTLFLLFKIGDFEWIDTPYEKLNEIEYPSFGEGKDAQLIIHIVDTATGTLMGIRTMRLGNIFSNKLHEVCRNLACVTTEENSFNVLNVYHKFHTSYSMLSTAHNDNFFMLKEGL